MQQICKFNTRPATVCNGGYKKGHWIVWLNLCVSESASPEQDENERFQSVTDRLVLNDNSIWAFIDAVDSLHLAEATSDELEAILDYFQVSDDIEAWKAIRQVQIQGYDKSEHVNVFLLDGNKIWLDKSTRVGLVNSINVEKKAQRSMTNLWYGSYNVCMDIDFALDCLYRLELYALHCFNTTAMHLSKVSQCESIEALKKMDIYEGYPSILKFKTKE